MKKPLAKVSKSYHDGHIKLRVEASACRNHEAVSASVSVDLDLPVAKLLQAELASVIQKEEEKMAAKHASEDRRKKWREREIAAGRLKIISFHP